MLKQNSFIWNVQQGENGYGSGSHQYLTQHSKWGFFNWGHNLKERPLIDLRMAMNPGCNKQNHVHVCFFGGGEKP